MASYQLPINLLIADDHQLITDGLFTILTTEKTIGEIYIAKNGRAAVDIALAENIDCVIMDINMPVLNGLEATRLIKKEKEFIKIIVVSMLDDPPTVTKMLRAGADGFINKNTGKTELLKAIELVMQNEKYVSPQISTKLFSQLSDRQVNNTTAEKPLTPRELEIIGHIASGLTNVEIAAKLFICSGTVDTHRKNILAKLNVKNAASLVKYASDHKLLS